MIESVEATPRLASESLVGEGYVAAVDLGGTKILAAIVTPDGQVVDRAKKSTGRNHEAGPVIDRIADCVREAAKAAGIEVRDLRAVGIGAPGPVVPETGVLTLAPNLGWHDVPLREELARRLGVPVVVDNDVRVAVLAEHVAGAGRGARSMVGFWVGTGIGGGIILNGELLTGATNTAGEVGHMTMKVGGPPCGCGGRGHLESLASRTAIVGYLAKHAKRGQKTSLSDQLAKGDSRVTSGDLERAYSQGDKLVLRAVGRSAKYLSIGIANVANLVNPELVVLGGGLVAALGDSYVRQVREELEGRPLLSATKPLKILPAALGDDSGIIGSGLIARRAAERLPSAHPEVELDESV